MLVGSDPAYGVTLNTLPQRVSVTFDEAVTAAGAGLTVTDRDGQRVDTGTVGSGDGGRTIRIGMRPGLPEGTYLITWVVLSADGHTVGGSSVFGFGEPPDLLTSAVPARDPASVVADGVVRMLTAVVYFGVVLAVGIPLVALSVWRRGLRTPLVAQLIRAGAVAVAVGSLSIVVAAPVRLAGADGWWQPGVWSRALDASSTLPQIIRLAAALLVACTAHRLGAIDRHEDASADTGRGAAVITTRPASTSSAAAVESSRVGRGSADSRPRVVRQPDSGVGSVVGGPDSWSLGSSVRALARRGGAGGSLSAPASGMVGIVVATALSGHAVAGSGRWMAVVSTAVHVSAMAVWVAGLVFAVLVWRRGEREALVPRLTGVASVAVGALAITGGYQIWRSVDPVAALWSTAWGRLMLAKLAVVAAALLAAFVARTVLRRFAASLLAVELSCQIIVLVVTAVLAGTTPARDAYDPRAEFTAAVGPLRADIDVDRAGVGDQEFTVRLRDESGTAVGAVSVGGQLVRADGGLEAIEVAFRGVDPVELGPKYFVSPPIRVPIAGMWRLRLTVATDRVTAYTAGVVYRVW
ncbi:copper resistance CopC/CopD family protein [Nocardia aurantia]|uniref:copper resistance CopC/CopD family protein n=1 Tax=Nocardia aurantia TaxID=2585199 RepID=UPI001885E24B|nr:copper resistance protein CopC [Nocardia aurantia]